MSAEPSPRASPAAVLERLWPDPDEGAVFAILDGARDPRVFPAVQRSGLDHRCLYSGPLEPVLARAAPYLVALGRDAPLARELAERWGDAWGIYLRSSADLPALHRHFRRFLRVQDEHGRWLVFRYYDPRVLRLYLPTCTAAELAFVFGPVREFVVETPGGDAAIGYRREDGRLVTDDRPLIVRRGFIGAYLRSEGMPPGGRGDPA